MSSDVYLYDESAWPVVRVVSPDGPTSDAEFGRHLQSLRRFLERRQRMVLVVEWRPGSGLSMEQRDMMRCHERQHRALVGQYLAGMALVVHSAFQRAMIAAVVWLMRSPSPTQVFSNVEDALAWASTLLGRDLSAGPFRPGRRIRDLASLPADELADPVRGCGGGIGAALVKRRASHRYGRLCCIWGGQDP